MHSQLVEDFSPTQWIDHMHTMASHTLPSRVGWSVDRQWVDRSLFREEKDSPVGAVVENQQTCRLARAEISEGPGSTHM